MREQRSMRECVEFLLMESANSTTSADAIGYAQAAAYAAEAVYHLEKPRISEAIAEIAMPLNELRQESVSETPNRNLKQELINEKQELDEKRSRLDEFIGSAKYRLPGLEVNLLNLQRAAMELNSYVLEQRIDSMFVDKRCSRNP